MPKTWNSLDSERYEQRTARLLLLSKYFVCLFYCLLAKKKKQNKKPWHHHWKRNFMATLNQIKLGESLNESNKVTCPVTWDSWGLFFITIIFFLIHVVETQWCQPGPSRACVQQAGLENQAHVKRKIKINIWCFFNMRQRLEQGEESGEGAGPLSLEPGTAAGSLFS